MPEGMRPFDLQRRRTVATLVSTVGHRQQRPANAKLGRITFNEPQSVVSPRVAQEFQA